MHTFALGSFCVLLTALTVIDCPGAREPGSGQSSRISAVTMNKQVMAARSVHLSTDSTIGDLLSHPAFVGFGRLILPWDDRNVDEKMPLHDIGALLPYHTHVNPNDVVTALNRMIDDASAGKTVFYDFYTEAQKQADSTKRNTGLFFFRGRPGAPFAIVSPGGGFTYVASVHEGFPYAVEINRSGYNVFVLRYRAGLGGGPATQDLAAALSYVFRNAEIPTHPRCDAACRFCSNSDSGADSVPESEVRRDKASLRRALPPRAGEG